MADVKKLIAGAGEHLARRPVDICLRGDLVAEYERLDDERAEAERALTDDRLGGKSAARRIAEQMEQVRQEMLDSTITFELRALPRHRFQALVDKHPPRRNSEGGVVDDDLAGVNAATFYDALIRASVAAPVLDEDDWVTLLGVHVEHEGPCRLDDVDAGNPDCPCRDSALTSRQYDALSVAAWQLNRHEVSVPFSRAASRLLQSSDSE